MDEIRNFLTIHETALKLDISEESVRDFIKAKELRAYKIGQWRINPQDLEAFIKSRMNF